MSDRKLLELAAKAAGIEVIRSRLDDPLNRDMLIRYSLRNPYHETGPWNPLTDDGDALRLSVKLGIQIRQYPIYDQPRFAAYACEARWDCDAQKQVGAEALVKYDGDPCAATRRAIVLAAAEIGRSMK